MFYDSLGNPRVGVPFTASNRDYEVFLYERDCRTPSTVPSLKVAEERSDELGFIDVTAILTVYDMSTIEASNLWNVDEDGASFSFCLDYMMFISDGKDVMKSNKRIINVKVGIVGIIGWGIGKQMNIVDDESFEATFDSLDTYDVLDIEN